MHKTQALSATDAVEKTNLHKLTGTSRVESERQWPQSPSHQAPTKAIFDSLGEGLIVTDAFGAITTVNAYALKALKFSETDLVGKWLPKTLVAVDEYGRTIDQLERPEVKSLSSGETVSTRSHYLTKDGDVLPVRVTASPIMDNGVPIGAIFVFQDLTTEQQLDIAKDEFVSLASHQLRTPATAVKSILSMLSSGDFGALSDQQKKYIDKAVASNDRQLHVIEALLNVALVDAGKMALDLDYIDIVPLLRDTASDHIPLMQGRSQELVLDIKEPQIKILADAQKLRMVVDNLLSNASKYSPAQSKITALIRYDQNAVHLSVIDQGVGIAPQEIPKLFTKFSRFENELSHEASGAGLGLFLTKSIVELHRGRLDVSSTPGEGSTFMVTLPTKWRINA